MRVEYINPFIEAVYELFSTMLASKATRGEVGVVDASGSEGLYDIMGLIGLSGYARGMVALSFPAETAVAIVNTLLGTDSSTMDDTVSDAIAEVVNIVAGAAKAKFRAEGRPPIDLSLPTVVRGSSFSVNYPSHSIWIEVPFNSNLGGFTMRVTFESDEEEKE
ncbi:MAG: chemotaxis protein CheX [Nitrospiraceae bacterium]|nr:chemotaxis protein CheX [Nitrospiraceae bacterium]